MFKYFLSMLLNIIFSNIVLVQIFEWTAMLYIIVTQENRSVGEILYDHQHENIDKPMVDTSVYSDVSQVQQIAYRRLEIKLAKNFKCAFISHNIICFVVYLAFIFDNAPTQDLETFGIFKAIGIFYFCILVLIEIGVFNALY